MESNKFIDDNGAIIEGTRVIIINNEFIEIEINDSLIGKKAIIVKCDIIDGCVVYDINIISNSINISKICFEENIEVDYVYYRDNKINDILDD